MKINSVRLKEIFTFILPNFVTVKSLNLNLDKINKIFAGKPVDVWAVGVTIYICTFLKLPFLPSVQSNMLELFKIIEKAE